MLQNIKVSAYKSLCVDKILRCSIDIYYGNWMKSIPYGMAQNWIPYSYGTPPFTNFGQWVYRKLLQYESVIKETHNEFIAKSVIAQNR